VAEGTALQDIKSEGRSLTPIQRFQGLLEKQKPQMANALPAHLKADRMARLAMTSFTQNPKLLECEPKSVIGSIITACQLGLEIGVNGQGYLVPYKGVCQFIPGWRGLVDLVARGGRGTVMTGVIYKDQKYTFTDGARRDLIVHNETDCEDPSDITHVYAIGWVKGAEFPIIELWRMSKVLKHRDRYNKLGTRHYSYENLEMYARKIPLLQVLKYMPMSIEQQAAVQLAEAQERGDVASMPSIDGTFTVEVAPPPVEPPTVVAEGPETAPEPAPRTTRRPEPTSVDLE
jgi:recombination protein RecT